MPVRCLLALLACVLVACASAPAPVAPPPPCVPPTAPPVASTAAAVGQPPVPAPLDGAWHGVLGGQLHLALALASGKDGLSGTLDSIDQGAVLALDHATLQGDALHFEIAAVGGSYDGTVAGDRIEGKWTQRGMTQPLEWLRGPSDAKREPPRPPLDAPVDVVVPAPPLAFRAGDRTHLAYELHVTSYAHAPVTLERIEVTGGGKPLARLEGAELRAACEPAVRLDPGRVAVVYVWLTLDGAAPAALDHRVTVALGEGAGEVTAGDVRVAVGRARPPVLGAPLRGKGWLAANGPANDSGHRRALIPIGGHARIAQRFAIDWVKLGDDGETFTGDRTKNTSYHAYGEPALAVADGVVVEARDGIPENVPGPTSRAVPITLDTIAGNHVVVDLGGGFFALWAHLQPGTVKVKPGDRVRRGQVLGLVGNSGNSTEPHLHFHVTDGASSLGAEGVPYALDSFEARPLGKPGTPPALAARRTRQLPAKDEVVSF